MGRRLGAFVFTVSAALTAQERSEAPLPNAAGAVAAECTPAEAFAFACCTHLAGERQGLYRSQDGPRASGYHVIEHEVPWLVGSSRRHALERAATSLAYFVPAGEGHAARRVFCVRGDGAIAWTDNTAGTAVRGGREPKSDDALGEGGPTAASNFPRLPTRGRDGNLWLPGEMLRTTRVAVRVTDGAGAALGVVRVVIAPGDPGWVVDRPLPAGVVQTLHEGEAVLVGVPAVGLAVTVVWRDVSIPVPPQAVAVQGGVVRVTVPPAELQRAAAARNESAAIAVLKNIASAQSQCQASGVIDVDQDGVGEFGTFRELSGGDLVRAGRQSISPPVLSAAFLVVENGIVERGGYCFRVLLPGKGGAPIAELPAGGADPAVIDADLAERHWCVYAWPLEAGVTGQRAFCISESGDVTATRNDDGRYSGVERMPAPAAARTAGAGEGLLAPRAMNADGNDRLPWLVVS